MPARRKTARKRRPAATSRRAQRNPNAEHRWVKATREAAAGALRDASASARSITDFLIVARDKTRDANSFISDEASERLERDIDAAIKSIGGETRAIHRAIERLYADAYDVRDQAESEASAR